MNASHLELSVLAATTTAADVDRAIDRALAEGFAAVVVPPAFAHRAFLRTREHAIDLGSVVSHPLGLDKPTVKAIQATSLAKDAVGGITVAPLAANLIGGDLDAYRQELLEIARGARAAKATVRLAVAIDLDWPNLDLPAIGAATIRGAFDGVAITSPDLDALVAAIGTLRGIEGLSLTAIARDAAWVERLLAAGSQRVRVAT